MVSIVNHKLCHYYTIHTSVPLIHPWLNPIPTMFVVDSSNRSYSNIYSIVQRMSQIVCKRGQVRLKDQIPYIFLRGIGLCLKILATTPHLIVNMTRRTYVLTEGMNKYTSTTITKLEEIQFPILFCFLFCVHCMHTQSY